MKHDEIVFRINDEIILKLLNKYMRSVNIDKIGNWSKFHFINQKEIKDFTFYEIRTLSDISSGNITISEFVDKLKIDYKVIEDKIKEKKIFEINKKYEFPLIKGEGQYKVTKGYADLIIHIAPYRRGEFSILQNKWDDMYEFFIEIKKEEDFKDFGSILRQINEYKEYYSSSVNKWNSEIIMNNNIKDSYRDTKFCILSTKIPESAKKILDNERILYLELDSVEDKEVK